jgi:hypothetical protein
MDMVQVTRETTWDELRALAKRAAPSRGLRDEFVQSIRQSLRVEGYVLAEAQVRRAVEVALHGAK